MVQYSRQSQKWCKRQIVEKAKRLFRRKKAGSGSRQEGLGPFATETTAQAAAGVPTGRGVSSSSHTTDTASQEAARAPPPGQGVSSSSHTTETAAQEAAVPSTKGDALDPQLTEAEARPPATAATPLLSSKNAPIWNQALQDFQQNYGDKYDWLVAGINRDNKACVLEWDGLFHPTPQKLTNHRPDEMPNAVIERVKAHLPSLSLVKGAAMSLAALDPHKVAPAVCAGVFFTIEVRLVCFFVGAS